MRIDRPVIQAVATLVYASMLAVLALSLLAAATQPASAPTSSAATQPAATAPADRSTVTDAVRVLWEGIRAGDVEKVAASLDLPDPSRKEFNHAVAELMVAGKKLSDAASKRFGKSGEAIGRTMIDFSNLDQVIQKLKVTQMDDTADVVGENQTKMRFHKRDNQWRLVVTDFASTKPANLSAQVKLLHEMAVAVDEAAREIESGKEQTVQEAERAIQDRLHAVMIERFRPQSQPSSFPATLPTSRP